MSGTPHGLIIAIEQYDPNGKIPAKLAGTAKAAREFRTWLETKKNVKPEDIEECVSEGWPAPTTTRDAIVAKVKKIIADWQNKVSELYVFVAGHGLSQRQIPALVSDYLLTSDFTDFDDGSKCVPLQELRLKLWSSLGPGEHYYFIDVCRTLAPPEDVELTNLGVKAKPSTLGSAKAYSALFSVRDGETAAVDSGFGTAVLDGLSGRGRAKQWKGPALNVTFNGMLDFIGRRIWPQEIDPDTKGASSGVILPIQPVPKSHCTIEIEDAPAAAAFDATVSDERARQVRNYSFSGPRYELDLEPDDYVIDVKTGGRSLERISPPPPDAVDVYDSGTVRFRYTAASLSFEVSLPKAPVPPAPPEPPPVAATPAHDSIRDAIGQSNQHDVWFSETLGGPVVSPDLSLWLSLLGASRIIKDPGTFSKLRDLHLASFEDLSPNASAIYLLTGFEADTSAIEVELDDRDRRSADAVAELRHVSHGRIDAQPGSHLVTLRLGEPHKIAMTIATHCLPNRVTLLVVVRGAEGMWFIRQLMLPLWTLLNHLDPHVWDSVQGLESLRTVQASVMAQTQFSRKRSVEDAVTPQDKELWQLCLYGKWLDPVMSLIAAYDIIRRGARMNLDIVLHNLRTYFSGIPDIDAIAALLGAPARVPSGIPLFLDGALALAEHVPEMRGAGKRKQALDYRTPWTIWIGPLD